MASRSKLTLVQLRQLHKRYLAGEATSVVARSAGISDSTLYRGFIRAGLPFRERERSTESFDINVRFPHKTHRALIKKAADGNDESMNQFIVTAALARAKAA